MKVVIDPGHGGTDPGAVGPSGNESVIALGIGHRLANLFSMVGATVMMTRQSDETLALRDRVVMANNWGADVFVSVHLNADPDPDYPGMNEATGAEVWYYEGSANGLALAKSIGAQFRQLPIALGGFRGEKPTRSLYVLRGTHMPAVLVETGFVDSQIESAMLASEAGRCFVASNIFKGVMTYLEGR